jgi:hypothetical protein
VQVTDAGTPVLVATQQFSIAVAGRPLITSIGVTSSVVSVTWSALPGQFYQLQYATNLGGESWSAIQPDVQALDDTVTHTNSVGAGTQQFYRVLVLP